ncbi:DNA polymerase III subunit alpha [Clostridium botulinum]|uniref:DNA polymerase III subunit alpha n=1 Tax=Clostridium botulinum (strain Hall / ATCC 3502 / NCTC 13319 / Type A) TaxID=441771 RepID=A5I822_CLOBH|nr:DNA polymerase III subunit alpha [Clostridium botulinum]NFL70830.1 DNA polymerase III subunit alpha [Clostridium botulinum]NFQ55181.1 DNA polymerase III subunit alpha [Clostridium botulinum]NFT48100.1 DNA polymerase III subunit alpha [Clostridium botulinum]QGT45390.1 DNA polymerase III subunit alpha [Clostridium botulinum]CAL81534.1 DNA polymerase III, subunit alpha [Clostridium botulinum A str. ATCC 3502]
MSDKKFTHLHLHTGYSLLDGAGKINNIIASAKELGMDSIAITDHGAMYGCVDFYKAAKNAGLKAIIGCEVYIVPKSMSIKNSDPNNKIYHLVLLVKNEIGYKNLIKIVSKASIDGFYYKPRTDHQFLKDHSEGLIALSACLGGEIQSNLLNENKEKAKEIALFYKSIFKDGFYLELQYHGNDAERKVNDMNIRLARELKIPLVATNDVHYIEQKDSKFHDILLCIQTGKTVNKENRLRYPSDQFYLKSADEMWEMFSHVPEALKNTEKIAEQCNFHYDFHTSKLPKFLLPEGTDPFEYMKKFCFKGLIKRCDLFRDLLTKSFNINEIIALGKENEEAKIYIDRLQYELSVIDHMGYVDYFLIVSDFIKFANEKKIPTGPGRGSGAGSLVAYTLGITKIDPIKYGLIFERFLNPERISMPDIDSDFCYERRGEIIDYVVEKYGKENVSQIITFGTMAARVCIRDVGRAMNYSYVEVDKIAKMIPIVPGIIITIDKALALNPELKNEYENNLRVKELIDVSMNLEGLPRHSSTHAAGIIISSSPIGDYVPLQKNEHNIVSQFDMTTLDELGFLKMDFLGLKTLTVLKDAVDMIMQNHNVDIDLDKIDINDKEVYKMIGEGKTIGIFQLESTGMTSFMKELKPDSLEDIIAGISLYRPGPIDEIPKYIENKKNPDKITYLTPQLEPILKITYGCLVYQEQVMEIVRKLAGYSMGRSDLVRRAMSKKKHKVMEEERKNFIYGIVKEDGEIEVPGCIRNEVSEKIGNELFDSMMDFASYAFNKSHAVAYALVAYQTAYLMKYYPAEYIAAKLNSVMGDNGKVAYYINYAESLGIQVLPPDINESFSKFIVEDNTIRFGLDAIKNVGIGAAKIIVKSRKKNGNFKSLIDFASKIDLTTINKRAIESLIKAGAFDCFKVFRSRLLAVYEKVLDSISNQRKRNIDGQVSLFNADNTIVNIPIIKYPEIKEFDKKYLLAMEKEMLGIYITGHPLDEYAQSLKIQTSIRIEKILCSHNKVLNDDSIIEISSDNNIIRGDINDGERVVIGGIITKVSRKITRNNTIMAFLKLEDLSGIIEVIVFPKTLENVNPLINEDSLVVIRGRVSLAEDELPKLICEKIHPLEKLNLSKVYIRVKDNKKVRTANKFLKTILKSHKGDTPIYIFSEKEKQNFRLSKNLLISLDEDILSTLRSYFGDENIKVVD